MAPDTSRAKPIIEVKDMIVRFDVKGGLLQQVKQRVHAVEKISFDLKPGETLALVGESGCGKSTTGKALMHLVPCTGAIRIEGEAEGKKSAAELKAIRRRVQMIF